MFFKRHSQGADGWRAAAHQPRRLQALRTERPPHRAARGPLLPRPTPRWPRNQGHRLLLNSPGRKLQGAGGRCGGFSKACGGALLAGTRARCPHVPSADAGAACCSPPRAGAPQPLLPHAPGQLRNTPRDPAGRGGWAEQGGRMAAKVSRLPCWPPSFPGRSPWRQRKQCTRGADRGQTDASAHSEERVQWLSSSSGAVRKPWGFHRAGGVHCKCTASCQSLEMAHLCSVFRSALPGAHFSPL